MAHTRRMINRRAAGSATLRSGKLLMSAHLSGNDSVRTHDAAKPARLSVAGLMLPRSLRSRLPILIAVVVTAVLTAATYAVVRSVGRSVERNLVETADRTARAVAADLAARKSGFDPADVRDTLHELMEANSVLRSISIVEVEPSQTN